MATSAHTYDDDLKFFDFLFYIAYPNDSEETYLSFRDKVADGVIQIESLLEKAIEVCNGNITKVSQTGRDFDDDSDAKKFVSCYRRNGGSKRPYMTHSYQVRKINAKVGALRLMLFNRGTGKFEFYVIPYDEYHGLKTIEIVIEKYKYGTHPQSPTGKYKVFCKWHDCQVRSFQEMSKITESDMKKKIAQRRANRIKN